MTNFQIWLDQADIPEQRGGQWVDLETGLPYNPEWDYKRNQQRSIQKLSAKSTDARAVAKLYGGKALTGSASQKEWAEKIRAEKLSQLTSLDDAELVCGPDSLCRTAKFWIDNRTRPASEFPVFVRTYRALLAKCKSLKIAGMAEEYKTQAAAYNAAHGAKNPGVQNDRHHLHHTPTIMDNRDPARQRCHRAHCQGQCQ
jgi:hypothetical protein